MTRRRNWWPTASQADRLVQVRAAAEIGLTLAETALMLGGYAATIRSFAIKHDVTFATGGSWRVARHLAVAREKRAMHSLSERRAADPEPDMPLAVDVVIADGVPT